MQARSIALLALALAAFALPAHARDRRDERIFGLAERLERAAHALHHAASERRPRSFREHRALRSLRVLDARARHFRASMERRGIGHPATRYAFERLERSSGFALARAHDLRGSRRLRHELRHFSEIVRRLDRRLAHVGRRDHHGRHHSRRDRALRDWRHGGWLGFAFRF